MIHPPKNNHPSCKKHLKNIMKWYHERRRKKENPSDIHHCDHTSRAEENDVLTCQNCGEELKKKGLNAIHAVGRAGVKEPRMVVLREEYGKSQKSIKNLGHMFT